MGFGVFLRYRSRDRTSIGPMLTEEAMLCATAFTTFACYNVWMNRKLYAASAQLDDEQRKRDLGAFFKSIHGTLNHLLLADGVWLSRFTGVAFTPRDKHGEVIAVRALSQVLYEDFEELKEQRSAMDERFQSWVATLTDDSLQREITYKTSAGSEQRNLLWHSLLHCLNHQTHHRGQITTLLTQLNVDVGDTDLIIMLREFVS